MIRAIMGVTVQTNEIRARACSALFLKHLQTIRESEELTKGTLLIVWVREARAPQPQTVPIVACNGRCPPDDRMLRGGVALP